MPLVASIRPDDASPSGADSAGVVELVDAPDSKSGTERCVGSISTARTIRMRTPNGAAHECQAPS